MVDDEWYAAHQTTNDTIYDSVAADALPYYLSDESASVLGCKEQYQSCDAVLPPEEGCSPLTGSASIYFRPRSPTSKWEKAFYWGITLWGISDIVLSLSSFSLTSRFTLASGIQVVLPADQWQREVENWHYIQLATLQGAAVDTAVGPGDPEMLKYFWAKPENDVERYLCKNQVCEEIPLPNPAISFCARDASSCT